MKRPLSPHLTIYKLSMPALMSISHRISGIMLLVGSLGFLKFFVILAFFPSLQPLLFWCIKNPIIQGITVLYAGVLFYHSINGIRHMIWDLGIGLDKKHVQLSGWVVVMLTLISLTVWLRAFYEI